MHAYWLLTPMLPTMCGYKKRFWELWYVSSLHSFELRAKHISGSDKQLADHLSWWVYGVTRHTGMKMACRSKDAGPE